MQGKKYFEFEMTGSHFWSHVMTLNALNDSDIYVFQNQQNLYLLSKIGVKRNGIAETEIYYLVIQKLFIN